MPSPAAEVNVQEATAGQDGLNIIPRSTNRGDSSSEDIQVHVNLKRTHPAEVQAACAPANGDEGLQGNRAGLSMVLLLNQCSRLLQVDHLLTLRAAAVPCLPGHKCSSASDLSKSFGCMTTICLTKIICHPEFLLSCVDLSGIPSTCYWRLAPLSAELGK